MHSLQRRQWSGRRFRSSKNPGAGSAVLWCVTPYDPPDPTLIEIKPEALDFWSRTLEQPPEKIKRAVQKVGPVLETVKKELGIGGGD
jgi:hypothetical protein